jgi:ABC-type cobalamin/Fe3+-siderophores transport system ATPase subunit
MQRSRTEFLEYIRNSSSALFCLVGPNYSGKSYILKTFFENYISVGGLLIDENGRVRRKVNNDEVFISSDQKYYVYQDEKQRGKNPSAGMRTEISNSSKEIIDIVIEYKKLITDLLQEGKQDSLGISKIMNIIEIFLTTNLNNINYVLLDEPENSLDDNNMKIVIEFVTKLVKTKKVVIVTHSPRLLELMQTDIGDIYKIKSLKGEIVNLSFNDIEQIYSNCGSELEKLNGYASIGPGGIIQVNAKAPYRNLYIKNIIKSQEFYRILFYNDVVLMEGKTEEFIIRETKYSQKYTKNVFYMDGKFKSYFLIEFFKNYCNCVYCFVDEDKKDGANLKNNFSYNINSFFNTKYIDKSEVQIFYFHDNIESELGVNVDEVMIDFVGEENKNNKSVKKICKACISLRYISKHPECVEKLDLRTNKFDF